MNIIRNTADHWENMRRWKFGLPCSLLGCRSPSDRSPRSADTKDKANQPKPVRPFSAPDETESAALSTRVFFTRSARADSRLPKRGPKARNASIPPTLTLNEGLSTTRAARPHRVAGAATCSGPRRAAASPPGPHP